MGAILRSATAADVPGMLVIYRPLVEATAISFELEPPAPEAFAERVRAAQQRAPWIVCAEAGAVLGYAYAVAFRERPAYRWSMETTVYVHEGHRRRCIGRGLYTALVELLRLQGFRMLVAGIALPNPASVRLHEALGFAPVGRFRATGHKLGAWHDVGFWELELGDPGDEPAAPRTPGEVLASAAGRAALAAGGELVRGPR